MTRSMLLPRLGVINNDPRESVVIGASTLIIRSFVMLPLLRATTDAAAWSSVAEI